MSIVWPKTSVTNFEHLVTPGSALTVPIESNDLHTLYLLNIGKNKLTDELRDTKEHAKSEFTLCALKDTYRVPYHVIKKIAMVFTGYHFFYSDSETSLSKRAILWIKDLARILILPFAWLVLITIALSAAINPSATLRNTVATLQNTLLENKDYDNLRAMTNDEVLAFAKTNGLLSSLPKDEPKTTPHQTQTLPFPTNSTEHDSNFDAQTASGSCDSPITNTLMPNSGNSSTSTPIEDLVTKPVIIPPTIPSSTITSKSSIAPSSPPTEVSSDKSSLSFTSVLILYEVSSIDQLAGGETVIKRIEEVISNHTKGITFSQISIGNPKNPTITSLPPLSNQLRILLQAKTERFEWSELSIRIKLLGVHGVTLLEPSSDESTGARGSGLDIQLPNNFSTILIHKKRDILEKSKWCKEQLTQFEKFLTS